VRYETSVPYSYLETATVPWTPLPIPPPATLFGSFMGREGIDFPTGTRNDGRSPAFWTFDARFSKEWLLGGAFLQLSADVFNLMNDDRVLILDVTEGNPNTVQRFGRRWQLGMRLAF
jgi:hypothetical protein